ncbi:UNVERIFIED_CONTAM: NADH-ubiquinone oxidoreductase chain 2 [Sesamum calycinum]|uniref:NADH-ubiquinone oxidoreductase chain 2 n=1 Tax=Sesamum calycinum TaxID=2727403 RepID=A0AAW2JPA7_9LAMI
MILGALAAMAQTKVKRLLAHSSIGHVGYIRTGFSCGTIEGIQSLLIGIFIYASMTIDAFAIVSALRQTRVKYIADLGALAKTNPILAITFSITMFSYAGIPPLAGFCSKFYLFFAALGCGAYFLAPVGVVTSVIGRWAAGRLPRANGGLTYSGRRLEPRKALLRGRSLAPFILYRVPNQHSYSSNGTQFISLSSIIDKIRFLHFSVRLRWGVFLRLRLKLRSCLLPNHSSPQDLPGGPTSDQDAGAEKDVEG